MADNYWDLLLEDDDHAANYMKSYDEGPGFATRHELGSFINDGESVLDVGCGPGWNLDHFIEYGPKISGYRGIDYSQRFVRVANQRWLSKGSVAFIETVDQKATAYWTYPLYRLGDARKLEEPDESYDVVIVQDCLEHTNGYEKPVSEALRVAKKRVIITFWRMGSGEDKINDDGNDGWGAVYGQEKWEKYLDTLDYMWIHDEIFPEGKSHSWHFYVIDKGEKHG